MNHCRFFQQVVGLILIGTLVTSCAKENSEISEIKEQVMISPVVRSTSSNSASNEGVVDENQELTLYFMRADNPEPSRFGGYEAFYDATKRVAIRTKGSGKQMLAFIPNIQYYNMDGTKTLLRGWFPQEDSFTIDEWGGASVKWTFNGSKDIMVSNFLVGDRNDKGINGPDYWFEFKHMLTQLKFYIYAETAATAQAWGKVTSIKVKKQANSCVFTPYENDNRPNTSFLEDCCEFDGEEDLDVHDIPDEGIIIPAKKTEPGDDNLYGALSAGIIMVQPLARNAIFAIEITTELNGIPTVKEVTVSGEDQINFAAGESAKVILNFQPRDIEIKLIPDNWIPIMENIDVDLGVSDK